MSLCRSEFSVMKIYALHPIRTGNDDPATLSDHTSSSNSDTPANKHPSFIKDPSFSAHLKTCSLENVSVFVNFGDISTFPDMVVLK